MRTMRSAVRVLLGVAAWAALGGTPRATAEDDDKRLADAVKNLAHGLPYAGQAKQLKDGLEGGYTAEGANGAVDYPAKDAKPPGMLFSCSWSVSGASKGKAWTEKEQKNHFFRPDGAEDGGYGPNSYMKVKVESGTQDPNMSGDPYIGSAEGGAVTECAGVTVRVTVSIWSDGSHGSRTRPEVLAALKAGVKKHLQSILGQFVAILRLGCTGATESPPATEELRIESECNPIQLVRGKLPSVPCGLYVKNWPPNTSVSTCFPDLQDAWGLLPNGVIVTFANEYFHVGATIPRGRSSDELYFSMWWYARCQAVPGVHTVEIRFIEGGPYMNIGDCPPNARVLGVAHVQVEVLAETSPNCSLPPPGSPGSGTGGMTTAGGGGGGGGGGMTGGGGGGTSAGGTNPFVGTFHTNFGDLTLTDAGGGNVRGTLGNGTTVTGKVKDDQFIGTFSDDQGDGEIHLITPDGRSVQGEWKRWRGSGGGTSGRITGEATPGGTNPGGGDPGLPGNGGGGDPSQPGGPGSDPRPPLRPIPAPLSGLTLQAPELRVAPGQEVPVSIWMLNATDVVNMNWTLAYDPAVVSASTAQGSVEQGNLLTGAFEANPSQTGLVRMGFAQKKGVSGTGTVSVHRMKAVGAVGSRTPLTLAVTTITDSRPQALKIVLLHGFIEVVAPGSGRPGSGNGQPPTMQDAYDALKMSVGLMPENVKLDVDRDGKVTSLDAYLIMTTVFLAMKAGK